MIRILHGDCRDVLKTLPAQSVQCCVTSPPYFGLRDYGVAGQIGLEPTPDEYVSQMVEVFREVRRVLADDGVVFLNLGDSYYNTSAGGAQGKTGQRASRASTATGSGAGARRAASCGTGDKAPAGYPVRDCLCQSLCDACRTAYRLGKSHSVHPLVSTPSASTQASNPGHIVSPFGRPPTSGYPDRNGHIEGANQGSQPSQDPGGGQPASSQWSKQQQSERQPPDARLPDDGSLACQLCGRSLPDCAQASARMAVCSCDTGVAVSADRMTGTGVLGLAYPDYTTVSPKSKDLLMIPARVAIALQADGWYLRSDIIWHKPNPMPESATDRPTSAHEHVFLLTKRERYFYDADAIAEVAMNTGGGTVATPDKAARAGITTNGTGATALRAKGAEYRNCRNVWTIASSPTPFAHFATMPPELAERCIKAGSKPGDTILDPFGGAGTTGLVADRLQRDAVLIELNPEYIDIQRRRVTNDAGLFAEIA